MTKVAFQPSVQMTFRTAEADRRRFHDYAASSSSVALEIDLEHVKICDSAGLAFLVDAIRVSKRLGRLCQIHHMSSRIQALATFCGVDSIFSIS